MDDSVDTTLRTPLSGTCLLKEVCRKPLFGVSVDTSRASEGMDLFVDLWEAQPCLWDPE